MTSDELTRYISALSDWIASNEAFASDLADLAADMKRSGRPQLADPLLTCCRDFRIRALELQGQRAAAMAIDTQGG